ncbi:hypothetical protein B5X24_HaOG200631 [Helicoverpa armigera]|nr:hypothetical protein B5X24_HaOG200631 [Helicoverpa armigera]
MEDTTNEDTNYAKEKEKLISESKKQILDTMHLINVIECINGIFRFSFVNNELLPPNRIMKMLTVFCILIYVIIFVFCFISLSPLSDDEFDVVALVIQFSITLDFLQYAACTVTATFLVNSNYIRIIDSLACLDTELEIGKLSNFYKLSRFETYKYIFLVVFTQGLRAIADWFSDASTILYTLNFLLSFIQNVEVMTFCKYNDMLRRRLKVINQYVQVFADEQEQDTATVFIVKPKNEQEKEELHFIGRPSDDNTKIRDLAKMYNAIGQICTMVNEVFNFLILAFLATTFTYIILNMWTCLHYYRIGLNDLGMLINITSSFFFWILYVVVISITCERLLLVRNDTKIQVNKIVMNYDLPKTMREQAKTFMELIEAWPLRIHVFDMFSVDISLMLKFISVATTYLIVVIQMFNLM